MGRIMDFFKVSNPEEDKDFGDEFDEPEFEEPEPEPEPETEEPEWDSAIDFADEILEEEGFADLTEFCNKSMMRRLETSPMHRDRIKSGVETMNMVAGSMRDVKDLRSEFGSEKSYEQFAEDIRSANKVMDQLDRMEGKEEQMANEILGLGHELIGALGEKKLQGGQVPTSVERSNEDI